MLKLESGIPYGHREFTRVFYNDALALGAAKY